jgi:hypothetical protein
MFSRSSPVEWMNSSGQLVRLVPGTPMRAGVKAWWSVES